MSHIDFDLKTHHQDGQQIVQTLNWFRGLLKGVTALTLWGHVFILAFVVRRFEELFFSLEMKIPGITRLLIYTSKLWWVVMILAIGYLVLMVKTKILDKVSILLAVQIILGIWIAFDVLAIYIPYFEMIGTGKLGGIGE